MYGRAVSLDLSDPSVRDGLRTLVASEAGGVEIFAAAARRARNGRERVTWETLHALEARTRAVVWDVLGEQIERFAAAERVARVSGAAAGYGLAAMPRFLQMRSLTVSTRAFLPDFVKLREHFAGGPTAEVFEFVVAHELAIAEIGRRGAAGDPALLQPAELLLNDAR